MNYLFHFVKVVNETLRLGNVVRFLHRKAVKDVNYKGMFGVYTTSNFLGRKMKKKIILWKKKKNKER